MHEASLAGGILRLVEDAARRDAFTQVTRLRLEAGQLSGVEARALRFALEAIAPGTCLQGAVVDIEEPPGTAWCLPCGASVQISQRGDACPQCGSHHVQPTGGTELRVIDLLVQ